MVHVERSITVRRPDLGIDAEVPVLWFAGRPGVTHFMNALGCLFPEGERFFVRSVSHFEHRIKDERLRVDVRAFIAQEVRHGSLHDEYNDVLKAQGIDLTRFFRIFRRICRLHGPDFTRGIDLSITAAVEHFTAVAAENALHYDQLAPAHPAMRRLYEWHALEELEHKSVAFDVLREVSGGSYALRMLGFLLVLSHMTLFMAVPFLWILAKAGLLFSPRVYLDLLSFSLIKERSLWKFLRGVLPYFRPGFHPDQTDESALMGRVREELLALPPAPPSLSAPQPA